MSGKLRHRSGRCMRLHGGRHTPAPATAGAAPAGWGVLPLRAPASPEAHLQPRVGPAPRTPVLGRLGGWLRATPRSPWSFVPLCPLSPSARHTRPSPLGCGHVQPEEVRVVLWVRVDGHMASSPGAIQAGLSGRNGPSSRSRCPCFAQRSFYEMWDRVETERRLAPTPTGPADSPGAAAKGGGEP